MNFRDREITVLYIYLRITITNLKYYIWYSCSPLPFASFLVPITKRDLVDSAIPTNRSQFGTKTDTFFHTRPRFVAFRKFSSSCRAASRGEYREKSEVETTIRRFFRAGHNGTAR